jgi:hypothetical protein
LLKGSDKNTHVLRQSWQRGREQMGEPFSDRTWRRLKANSELQHKGQTRARHGFPQKARSIRNFQPAVYKPVTPENASSASKHPAKK